ncbi:MAG: GGDEF domain-containing protein [Actinomycetota bacterium]|nr:GGDEF domain-containing protein [Actinomycetota bacterium]
MASERDGAARNRDETARERDRTAEERDRTAEELNRDAARLAQELGQTETRTAEALEAAAIARARGATGRAHSATDRGESASDREAAAEDRKQHQRELEHAELDELTGAYRRGLGEVALGNELERAQRSGGSLVLAYIDVDGLKEVNDRRGHAAGDALLCDVVAALRSKLRPYDPVVRWGGDEFVCAIPETELDDARRRIDEARAVLGNSQPDSSISVGLAALREGETLKTLINRADLGLLEARLKRKPSLGA